MIGLDTNILIRYLVQDDANQSRAASTFIEKNCTERNPCCVGHITLCELAWVLESNYGQNREQIADIIEQLLQIKQLEMIGTDVVWKSLSDYRASNADFPDHLIARVNEEYGCSYTATFDKKAGKQPAFKMLTRGD